jgi:hypothetical protein
LKRLGQADLARETWTMAGWIRDQRTDPDRDDEAVIQAQRDLLVRVHALSGLDTEAREQIAHISESIDGYAQAWAALGSAAP